MIDPNDTLLFEISDWIIKAMDNSLSREEFDRFQHLLKTNPLAREYYYDILATYAGVDEIKAIFIEDPSLDLAMWQTLADIEKTAPAVAVEKTKQKPDADFQAENTEKIVRKVNKVSLTVAITSLAALLLMIIFVNYLPSFTREEVATLTDSVNAQWAESNISATPNTRLAARQGPLTLEKGVVKLQFDSNARVVIEAPAKFEITTGNQIQVYLGRAYATVPPEAIGFTIKTLNTEIVDLGTEFGVQVDHSGATELHVLKGKTTLISGSRDRVSTMLTEGAAKRISGVEAKVSDIQCDQNRFVREINSKNRFVWRGEAIRLADIVGEGNGMGTGTVDIGINPLSGQTEDVKELDRFSDNSYVVLPQNPFIDGVFVPNGTTKQIVSSRGDVFKECPPTSGYFYTEIANTPRIVTANSMANAAAGENSFIFLHANLGITFDLNAIRSLLSGVKIKRFESKLRISEAAPRQPNGDFWVLVDGKVRYSKKNVTQKDSVDSIIIALQDNDRFLTLATTDGQDPKSRTLPDGSVVKSIDSDWCVFDKPVLAVE